MKYVMKFVNLLLYHDIKPIMVPTYYLHVWRNLNLRCVIVYTTYVIVQQSPNVKSILFLSEYYRPTSILNFLRFFLPKTKVKSILFLLENYKLTFTLNFRRFFLCLKRKQNLCFSYQNIIDVPITPLKISTIFFFCLKLKVKTILFLSENY